MSEQDGKAGQQYIPDEWNCDGKVVAWRCNRCPVVVFSPGATHDCEADDKEANLPYQLFLEWYKGRVLAVGVGDAFIAGFAAGLARGKTWQPTEDAPKDGTPILLWWSQFNRTSIAVGYWWRDHWYSEQAVSRNAPTHWLSLPEPLAERIRSGEEQNK